MYIVEFKVGSAWIKTRTLNDLDGAVAVEKKLHDCGIKARIKTRRVVEELLGS